MRPAVEVRPADREDVAAVVALTLEARDESAYTLQAAAAEADRLLAHVSTLMAAGAHVLVAVQDGEVCGFLIGRVVGPHLFADTASLYIDTIFVAENVRRRGVGHALVAGAAAVAAEAGAEHVYCAPLPGARGMQRFLAQLGFAPAAGHRLVSTAALQRRFAQDPTVPSRRDGWAGGRRATRAAIEDLIARRRRARSSGLPSGAIDLRDFQSSRRESHRSA